MKSKSLHQISATNLGGEINRELVRNDQLKSLSINSANLTKILIFKDVLTNRISVAIPDSHFIYITTTNISGSDH